MKEVVILAIGGRTCNPCSPSRELQPALRGRSPVRRAHSIRSIFTLSKIGLLIATILQIYSDSKENYAVL